MNVDYIDTQANEVLSHLRLVQIPKNEKKTTINGLIVIAMEKYLIALDDYDEKGIKLSND